MSAQVHALRQLLEKRHPHATPLPQRSGGIATRIASLDHALPGAGLPRGRLTAWTSGGGATAVLRSALAQTVQQGERAAWIDGAGTLTADAWIPGSLLLRPRRSQQALESAEALLRSGGIALLVLAGVPTTDTERVRLSRALRAGGTALVAVDGNAFLAALRVSTRVLPSQCRWRPSAHGEPTAMDAVTLCARISASGWQREAIFSLPVAAHELRLSLEPELGDRRGRAC
jgi:hypothetical protein